jgi:ribosomal subunit interface protein
MEQQVQVTFRGISHSDALDAHVRERATQLETFATRITGCHVAVEAPHQAQQRPFRVRIDLTIPGAELVVGNTPDENPDSQDAYAAIDHAFELMGRRLRDYLRRQRGDVKTHSHAYREGHVTKLWPVEGYGFLESPDGGEIYFHRNSVLHGAFAKLVVGSKVRFVEELGDKGPQASTVTFHA